MAAFPIQLSRTNWSELKYQLTRQGPTAVRSALLLRNRWNPFAALPAGSSGFGEWTIPLICDWNAQIRPFSFYKENSLWIKRFCNIVIKGGDALCTSFPWRLKAKVKAVHVTGLSPRGEISIFRTAFFSGFVSLMNKTNNRIYRVWSSLNFSFNRLIEAWLSSVIMDGSS